MPCGRVDYASDIRNASYRAGFGAHPAESGSCVLAAPTRPRMRVLAVYGTVAAGCALAAAGCGEQSALEPRSDAARTIETLWWWMFAVA